MKKTIILGAGISGISAAYHLKKNGLSGKIYEKNNSWGGLCDNFEITGFRFDKFIHLSFTHSEYVKSLFGESSEIIKHLPNPINYYKGHWIKHPAQNNLYPLDVQEKIKIIKEFVELKFMGTTDNIENYEQWLKAQYGNYFSENFAMKYTEKYWTLPASNLETKWVGNRMYKPNLEEVLEGAMSQETPNTYYAQEMRYPTIGGYKSFLNGMAKECDINLNKEALLIDVSKGSVIFSDGTSKDYGKLISSIPLPEICKIIKNIPKDVLEASKKLKYTSGALISIGFNKEINMKNLWMYIYDEDIETSRIYSPSIKSPNNTPFGCSSIQGEVYFSGDKPLNFNDLDELLESEIENYIRMGLFNKEDIAVKDIRIEKYANIIFNHDVYKNRKIVLDYLNEIGIISIGRFGEWEYFWSDQALLSGKKGTEKAMRKKKND